MYKLTFCIDSQHKVVEILFGRGTKTNGKQLKSLLEIQYQYLKNL